MLVFLHHSSISQQTVPDANPQEGYNAVNMFPSTMWVLESLTLCCGEATHVDWVSKLCICSPPHVHGSSDGLQSWQNSIQGFRMPFTSCLRTSQADFGLQNAHTLSDFLTIQHEHACAN